MPRKKLDLDPSVPAPTPLPTTPEPKKPTRARAAKSTKPAPEIEPVAVPEKVAPKPRARRVAKVAEPTPEPEPIQAEAPAKPSRPARVRKPSVPVAQAAPVETLDAGDLSVTFRPRVSAASPAPAVAKAAEKTPSRRGGRTDRTTKEKPTYEAIPADDRLIVLEWRGVGSGPAPEASSTTDAAESEEGGKRNRRRGRGRGRGREEAAPVAAAKEDSVEGADWEDEEEEPVAAKAPPIPVKPAAPVVPVKPAIQIPNDAPQVIVRSGVPALVRDGNAYPPIMFFGNPSDEKRGETVLEQLQMAAESGIHLHSFLVEMEVDLDQVEQTAGFAAFLLGKALEVDSEAQIIFRIVFLAPRGWENRYPQSVYTTAQGDVAEPSICDDGFWGVAEQCLDRFVRKLRLLETRNHIMGVHLERGEWFYSEGVGYDTSRAAVQSFRDWARRRYLNDEVTLRASWFDGSARFDNIQVPEYRPEGGEGERFIRSSRRQRRYVDYHLFLSDAAVSRISDLAYVAKAASEGMFIVGVSYGYTFEWSHPASGHLALGKLLRTEEIDFIAGPPSYRSREPGGTAPFPGPIDSFALNGKLYFSEEDFKTSLSRGHEPDDFNPALKTPQALESVHWRGAGAALAHGSGVAWMDVWGNGWLKTHSVWERAHRLKDVLVDRMEAPLGDPEVAVFIDERALAYLVDSNAFALLVQNVRESVLRAGVSAAFYLLSDLAHREKFPESKLYLFLNAWDIRPDLRAAIKSRLQRDNKVLFWLYSAGLFDAGRDSLERAREVTGIALKPQPFYSKAGTTILNRRHPLSEAFPDRSVIGGTKLEPSYFAIPEGGVVLGEYTQTGLPSFVVKDFREDPNAQWTSVFLGEPLVNPALIRTLAQMAGAHVWNFHDDVVHVRAPFCTVHCSGTGPRTITLPDKFSAYDLIGGNWAAIDSTNLRFHAIDGSTHSFLVGPRVDIEHLLAADPAGVLKVDELPPREQNVRTDSSNFDVPIMKLDEWMEGGDQDEVADEWFLRPPQLIEEEAGLEPAQASESPEEVGRRRRRRRRGRGGSGGDRVGSDEIATARSEPSGTPMTADEFTMNVMFRKRE